MIAKKISLWACGDIFIMDFNRSGVNVILPAGNFIFQFFTSFSECLPENTFELSENLENMLRIKQDLKAIQRKFVVFVRSVLFSGIFSKQCIYWKIFLLSTQAFPRHSRFERFLVHSCVQRAKMGLLHRDPLKQTILPKQFKGNKQIIFLCFKGFFPVQVLRICCINPSNAEAILSKGQGCKDF